MPRNIKARLLLRTGRLAETLELLQEYDSADEHDRYSSRGQRETKLILSLVHALKMCIRDRYGAVCLRGTSIRDRVKLLISIAHPDFRPWLQDEAKRLKLI